MVIYFSGGAHKCEEILLKHNACRLFSYLNDKKSIEKYIQNETRPAMLVDSGAFSVAHSGASVDIDEYIKYINEHPMIENFIELDVIPYPVLTIDTAKESAEKSWDNYLYMIERLNEPYKLLPVYHYEEDIKYFKQMLEFTYKGKHIPFICLNYKMGNSKEKTEAYFTKIFDIIKNSSNPDVKIHILGLTVFDILKKFPFYSADSTTHIKQAAYGLLFSSWGPINIGDRNTKFSNYKYMASEARKALNDEVNSFGYNLDELTKDVYLRTQYNIDFTMNFLKDYKYSQVKAKKKKLI